MSGDSSLCSDTDRHQMSDTSVLVSRSHLHPCWAVLFRVISDPRHVIIIIRVTEEAETDNRGPGNSTN